MGSKLLLAALVLTLTACGPKTQAVKPDAVPEGCDAACRTPCVVDDTIVYKPDPYKDAIDEIVKQVVAPLLGEVQQCEAHRTACVQCLDRLQQAGVTR